MTWKVGGRSLFGIIGLFMLSLLAGCGGGDGGGSGAQAGIVSVSLTDAPACGYDEVWVTVKKIRIHQSAGVEDERDRGWTDITLSAPRPINLLTLNDPTDPRYALESLGEASLPAGHYTQLRLILEDNTGNNSNANWVVLSDGTRKALDTPSAIRTGIKLIHQFTVGSGQRVDLLLDFDACHSIVKTGDGEYKLKPVIKVIPFELNGIDGYVDTSLAAAGNVMVSAQMNGDIARATVPNPVTGKFFLARLNPGHYDVVLAADGRATTVISGVPVAASPNITHISTQTVHTPIQLSTLVPATRPLTGTVTFNLSPPLPVDDESVFVVAKQQLNNGPLVTVQSHVASVLTIPNNVDDDYGYSMSLPTDSPWLASGSGALPLPLTAFVHQAQSVAGKYTIQASATGYTTQSANVDIALVSQQNFVLPKIVAP